MCVGKTPASMHEMTFAVLAQNEVLHHNIAAIKEARTELCRLLMQRNFLLIIFGQKLLFTINGGIGIALHAKGAAGCIDFDG
jgi:hypothetical protein